jgi:hypothetical protein
MSSRLDRSYTRAIQLLRTTTHKQRFNVIGNIDSPNPTTPLCAVGVLMKYKVPYMPSLIDHIGRAVDTSVFKLNDHHKLTFDEIADVLTIINCERKSNPTKQAAKLF